MTAFDIYLNGEKVCTAGGSELTALSSAVSLGPTYPDKKAVLTVSGFLISSQAQEFLNWGHRDLRVGDRVEIQVVETSAVDKPTRGVARIGAPISGTSLTEQIGAGNRSGIVPGAMCCVIQFFIAPNSRSFLLVERVTVVMLTLA